MKHNAPIVFAFVLSLAFLLLLVTFRSIVIPIKAIALNLLSVGAAYGILTWIFQDGRFEKQLGYHSNGGIAGWLPMFLFVILFGLSMDYHVFILSRVREAFDRGMKTEDAVAHGIKATAGTVTSAAIVMVVVFGMFATESGIEIKELGIGLALAILIDATIVRAVLLPATMKLLGKWNWYLPSKLNWLPEVQPRAQAGRGTGPRLATATVAWCERAPRAFGARGSSRVRIASARARRELRGGRPRRSRALPARARRGALRGADRRLRHAAAPRRAGLPRRRALPGARPHARRGRGRGRAPAGREGGRGDRPGAAHRARARLAARRLAPRVGDAAPDARWRSSASTSCAPRGEVDLGGAHVRRDGARGILELRNPRHLNAEDDTTLAATEAAVDLVLLDPEIEVGVLPRRRRRPPALRRAGASSAPGSTSRTSTAARSRSSSSSSATSGYVNKLYRGLSAPERQPGELQDSTEKLWIAAAETYAIGGACQLLHVMDHVIAERGCRLYLPARKEGIIPGASNLRLPRFGRRPPRPPGDPLRARVRGGRARRRPAVRRGRRARRDGRGDRRGASSCSRARAWSTPPPTGARCASAQEPLDVFRAYMALYAREQAFCHFSPALIAQPRAPLGCHATAVSDVERAPREQPARRCSSSACARRSRACSTPSRSRARACTRPACARPRTSAASTTCAGCRSPTRPTCASTTRSACWPCRARSSCASTPPAARAASRPSSATPARDLDAWTEVMARCMAMAGVRAGDGRPQRQRLRALHRRARLPPGRRAARRDGRPGLGRLHRRARSTLLRDLRRPGALRHPVLRAAHRPGAARRRHRPRRPRARGRPLRRRAVDRGDARAARGASSA